MNKKKILIISISVICVLIAAVSVVIIKGGIKNFRGYFNDEETTLTEETETVETETISGRDKTEMPVSIVSVIYDSVSEKSMGDMDKLTTYGFNSVIFDYSKDNEQLIATLINYTREKGIYTGLRYSEETSDDLTAFFTENNVDFIIISGRNEKDESFVTDFSADYTALKDIDANIYIGYEPEDTSDISDEMQPLEENDKLDFIFVTQSGINDTGFTADQEKLTDETADIWMNHCLSNLDGISSSDASKMLDIITASVAMDGCRAISFYPYSDIASATSENSKEIRNYILKRENYLEDKDFSITNYDKTTFSVDSPTITFKGTSSPLHELTCNGTKIKTAENGDFSVDFNLSAGLNKIVFTHKDKTYTYNVTYNLKILKSVSPNKAVTVPGGIEVEVTVVALKGSKVTVSFNGGSYTAIQSGGTNGDDSGNDTDSDFASYTASLPTPAGKTTAQKLGSYKVTATYNGKSETKTGATITVSANEYAVTPASSTAKTTTVATTEQTTTEAVTTTAAAAESESLTDSSDSSGRTEKVTKTTATHEYSYVKTTVTTTTTTTAASQATTQAATDSSSDLQQYDYTKNYGLGSAKLCLIVDDYVETYSGSNTSSKSVPDCSPLLKGTVDYITGTGTCSDDSDNVTYYYLASGVKVPLFREENTSAGSNTKITHLKVVDGYVMPTNNIKIVSCTKSGGNTVIKLAMNRLVAFNAKLTGQTYSSYNGRMVAVSSVDCTGLQFTFSDTDKISGNLSFSGSVVKSGSVSVSGTTATMNLTFANAGKFYGFGYTYSNGILTITIKSKPSSLSGYTIMLDPGHGGYDGGASCVVNSSSWSEKKINLSIATKVKELLEAEGATVIMTRTEDTFFSLSSRNNLARSKLPDLFISIHCDSSSSSSAYGTSAYYYRAISQPLAKYIHSAIVSAYNNSIYSGSKSKVDRGTSFYAFKVTRIEECPSVLIEYGFVSNTEECEKLQSSSTRDILAKATVTGIKNYVANS